MKRNQIITLLIGLVLGSGLFFGFKSSTKEVKYQQVTTIESVVPGGLGRSRLLLTQPDGSLLEQEMKNFFSITGINFGNIQANDLQITETINKLTAEGWSLEKISTGVYGADKRTGIFITRYLFKKAE